MGWILFRGQRYKVESNKTPISLIIPDFNIIITDTVLGEGVSIWSNVNIYGAFIDRNAKIASFVEIRKGVGIGENTKVEPFVFIPEGVKIGKCVFIGPNVCFTNDKYPEACLPDGSQKNEYEIIPTIIEERVSIGAGSVILCGITIGKGALIGAGSVVADSVPENAVVYSSKSYIRRRK
jgi:acetyltransferase-like isoleucine patch superfamily enzyme